ncbi:hypothetical protein V5O48_006845 [Marasmius crinis-equi]|uniref:Uncharacterized protein n=1 Tax=Marasmius crinis-equi TaxID=585013 RepID=A0ABR3FIB9_9AGAR
MSQPIKRKCIYCPKGQEKEFEIGRPMGAHVVWCKKRNGIQFADFSLPAIGEGAVVGGVEEGLAIVVDEREAEVNNEVEVDEGAGSTPQSLAARPRRIRALPKKYREMDLTQASNFLSQAMLVAEEEHAENGDVEDTGDDHVLDDADPEDKHPQVSSLSHDPGDTHASDPTVPYVISQKDGFGMFRVYQYGLPSRNPDEDVTMDDLIDSGGFAMTPTPARRPDAAFGHKGQPSLPTKSHPYAPFDNSTVFQLMDWYYNAAENGLSLSNFNELVGIFRRPDFDSSHIATFDASREGRRMDAYRGDGDAVLLDEEEESTPLPFASYKGWRSGEVNIPVPRTGHSCAERDAYVYTISDVWHRKAMDIIRDEVQDTSFYSFHLKPYKQLWEPGPSEPLQRIYSEVYSSDRMLAMERDALSRRPPDCECEAVVVAIMGYSDSTQLTHFGDRSLWPGYIAFGNTSKYRRSNPSMFTMNHIVYVPTIPDSFARDYRDLFDRAATDDVLRFVKRELVQLVWALIMSDPGFVDAYQHGKVERCADGILRRLFPRLFAHSADYVEKVLLASIKFLSEYLCPQCLTKKSQVHQLGTKWDQCRRLQKREDSDERRERIEIARRAIFQHGMAIGGEAVTRLVKDTSEQVDRNTFSELLHPVGENFYDILVADTMHEMAGLMEAIFKQCNRLIFAEDKNNLEVLNDRYRRIATFDNGTIRRFANDVTKMKKFAFRDFEDVMQGLLPTEHDKNLLNLLWDFNVLMAYASLRLHTDSTVATMDSTITQYGKSLRRFVNTTCKAYNTTEIPEEAEKRRLAALNRETKRAKDGKSATKRKAGDEDGLMPKNLNMNTFKQHMPTHYPFFVRHYGSLDSYTTRMGEREHVRTKRLYNRTNKRNHEPQVAMHFRRARLLHSIRVRARFIEHHKHTGAVYVVPDKEKLPLGNPKERYQLSASERYPLRLYEFLDKYAEDPAMEGFYDSLRTHLICRMRNIEETTELDRRALNSLRFDKNRIYAHKTFRIHYNTYDLRRKAQTISPRFHPDVMLLADEVTAEMTGHPYCYARVIGIFHANVWLWDKNQAFEEMSIQKKEFLWVRWYEMDMEHTHGWRAKRLPKIYFLPSTDPNAFGFIDPARVVRGVFLEPAFEDGSTSGLDPDYAASIHVLPEDSVARVYEASYDGKLWVESGDWCYYYVNFFGDRDLFMRYRGGGVGHSTRSLTRELEHEATENDNPLPEYDRNTGELVSDNIPEDIIEQDNPGEGAYAESSVSSSDETSSVGPSLDQYDSNDNEDDIDYDE